MNKNKKLTVAGFIFFVLGLLLTFNFQFQTSQSLKSFQEDSRNNSAVSESLFFTLNHIENDLNRLRRNISYYESSSSLLSYNKTHDLVLNLVTWIEAEKKLSKDSLLARLPSFPNQERLKDNSILQEWKIAFNSGLKKLSSTVLKLNLSSNAQKEFRKKLVEIDVESKKIRWVKSAPRIPGESFETKMTFDIINQIQKNLNSLDQTLFSGENTSVTSPRVVQDSLINSWIAFSILIIGMVLVASSVFMQNNNSFIKKYKEKIKNKSFDASNERISEVAILNLLDQAIFYLSSNNEIIWSNKKAQEMVLSKSDISKILKNAYKDENGKKISSFKDLDYSIDVEFLDQKNQDGSKIFCLIMKQVNDYISNIELNAPVDEKILEASQENHHFDFSSLIEKTLTSMSHVFKLSGTEYKFDSSDVNLCFCDFNKIELSTRSFLSAIHQLIKDDFDIKQVIIKTSSSNGHLALSTFVPSFNFDGASFDDDKRFMQQMFLDDMKKIEKNLAHYSAKIVIRKQNHSDNNVEGFFVELSLNNKGSPKEISDKKQVLI
jgi:uncharacterized membrane protein